MAAEDAVVDTVTSITTKLLIAGTEIGLKITGAAARAIGVSFYALAKAISNKRSQGKALTPGEVEFESMMQSGEEIHSIWLKNVDLNNFSQIAKQMGIPFVAIKNGDELEKTHGFLHHHTTGNAIEFADDYKDKVSISYRVSDEVRIAHILEMFNTFNKSETTTVEPEIVAKEEFKDEVEQFIEENGVQVERPPEVLAAKEVNTQKFDQVSATSSTVSADEELDNVPLLCFSEFGFESVPSQAEYDAAYIKRLTDAGINPSEPNYFTSLYEQGSKIIGGEITPTASLQNSRAGEELARKIWKDNIAARSESFIPEGFRYFGFEKTPSVDELKKSYSDYISQNTGRDAPAKAAYESALNEIEKGKSIREKLKAKQELHTLKKADKTGDKVLQREKSEVRK